MDLTGNVYTTISSSEKDKEKATNSKMMMTTLQTTIILFSGLFSSVVTVNKKPHIIFILADDLGWNDIPWHNSDIVAPNLANLAKTGVILEQSYVQQVCTPSRAAALTGRYPFTLGRQHQILEPFTPTGLTLNATLIPQVLKQVGYSSYAVGKWHLGFCKWQYTPTYRGFDSFYGFYNGDQDYYTRMKDNGFDFRSNTTSLPSAAGPYSTELFSSYVENLLAKRNPNHPMFLYLPLQSVHVPLQVPIEFKKMFAHVNNKKRLNYMAMVAAFDKSVGRIVAALKKTKHYDNSVIIFSTDNGGPMMKGANNWPLRGGKNTLYEGGTRGAAFVNSPLLPKKGVVFDGIIHITDWFPTIANLAGAKVPKNLDGIDQWDAIAGRSAAPRSQFVYNIDFKNHLRAAIQVCNYKLIASGAGSSKRVPPPEGKPKPPKLPPNTYTIPNVECQSLVKSLQIQLTKTEAKLFKKYEGNKFLFGKMRKGIKLYDLSVDPNETKNIAEENRVLVKKLLLQLFAHYPNVVPDDSPNLSPAGNPKLFNNVWSPGWC